MDALDHIGHGGHRIGPEAAEQRDALVVGYIVTDPGIQTHGADVQTQTVIAADQVKFRFLRIQQPLQIPERLRLGEHSGKIVAAATSEGGDGHIAVACRAVDDLVQGAVAAAGVDTVFLSGLGCLSGNLAAAARGTGYLDAVI